jgi:chromosome segregation ATPase
LYSELKETQDKEQKYRTEFLSKIRENEALEEKHKNVMILSESLITRQSDLVDDLERFMNQNTVIQQQVDRLEKHVTRLDSELKVSKSQNMETSKLVTQLEEQLKVSESQNMETSKLVTQLEEQLKVSESQSMETSTRVTQLEEQLKVSESQNMETSTRVTQVEGELKELKDDFTEYKAVGRLRRSSREYIKITSDAILKGFATSQGKKTVSWRYVESRCKSKLGYRKDFISYLKPYSLSIREFFAIIKLKDKLN